MGGAEGDGQKRIHHADSVKTTHSFAFFFFFFWKLAPDASCKIFRLLSSHQSEFFPVLEKRERNGTAKDMYITGSFRGSI